MATIVQPYNPWKEQLVLTALGNVAGNILNDLWQSHRQNEQNRKANAFRGQLQQDLAQQGNISLTPQEAPQGYNSNPWANALHQSFTPFTAFDIGTAQRQPSIQDIVKGADSLAASKRFSMLSPELVQGVKNSMIQQAENQRLKDLQNNFADMFGNAKSPAERMNILVQSVLQGAAPYQALTAFSPFAAHMSPHRQAIETDTGNTKRIDAFDPLTGNITPGAAFKVGVSPNTAINAGSAENVARINALGDEARAQATVQAQQLKIWQEQHKALSEEIANDRANLAGLNEQEAIAMQSIINQKEQRLAQLEMLMSGAYSRTGSSQPTQGDLGNLSYWGETSNGMGKDIHGKSFDYSALINKYAERYGVDPDLAVAVMKWESGGNAGALSNKGAVGLFQLMPKTAQDLGVNPHDVEDNIKGGIMYLRQMLDKYNGNLELALRAYNAGPGATDAGRYPAETQKYVPGVLGIYRKLRSNRPQKKPPKAPQSSQPQQQPQTQPQNTATQTQPQTTGQPTTQGQPYLRNSETGQTLSLQEFEELRDINHTSANDLFDALTDRGWEIDNGQQNTPQLPITALNDTQNVTTQPQTSTNSEPVQRTNRPFPLPGQPNFPKAYDVHDVIGAINFIKNTENPFSRPNVQDWHEPLNPAPVQPVSADANPWSYVQQNTSPAWSSFDIHQPILGGQRQQPLPQQQTVSNDSRLSPLFSGSAVNAASDFLKGLNLTSGDETAITPKHINPDIIDYSFDPRYSGWQRSAWQNAAGYDAQQILGWINSHQNNEYTFARPQWDYKQNAFPAQVSYPYRGYKKEGLAYPVDVISALSPTNAYEREKIDGEYQFLEPQLTALNGGLPYWYGGPLSDDAYQINFLLNSLGVTADKYPYIKKY